MPRRSKFSGLVMRLMNPNFREPREIAKVNQTAINVITNLENDNLVLEARIIDLESEIKELLFKRHAKRTKAEEARFRQLLGMTE